MTARKLLRRLKLMSDIKPFSGRRGRHGDSPIPADPPNPVRTASVTPTRRCSEP